MFRSIDVIASNQARLPMILRKDNNPFGEIIEDADLLKIFNNTANQARMLLHLDIGCLRSS